MINLNKSIYIGIIICIFSACGKKQNSNPSTPNPTADVYLAGGVVANTGFSEAVYWKNGVAVKLVTDSSSNSGAVSIAVSGSNVCVAGYVTVNGTEAPVYWENGVIKSLPNAAMQIFPHSIAISGNDVYFVGVIFGNGTETAAYWKNGVLNTLLSTETYSSARAIFVSGNDIYIAGTTISNSIDHGTYWKNGVATVFPDILSQATDITVNGNDVYVADNSVAYWKNGVHTKMTLGNNIVTGISNGIAVSGNGVYLTGFGFTANQETVATYWKNDGTTNVTSQVSLSAPSNGASSGAVIALNGSDVYIAGQFANNYNSYWKNGSFIPVTGKPGSVFISGMAILTH
jgi:hypothetical protein